MEVGLIDVDNRDRLNDCFPNLALMKLSSWHKKQYEKRLTKCQPFGGEERGKMMEVFVIAMIAIFFAPFLLSLKTIHEMKKRLRDLEKHVRKMEQENIRWTYMMPKN